jgi:hypothetical protein
VPFVMTPKECSLHNIPIWLLSRSNVVTIWSSFWSGNPPVTALAKSKNREIVSSKLNTRGHCPLPGCRDKNICILGKLELNLFSKLRRVTCPQL